MYLVWFIEMPIHSYQKYLMKKCEKLKGKNWFPFNYEILNSMFIETQSTITKLLDGIFLYWRNDFELTVCHNFTNGHKNKKGKSTTLEVNWNLFTQRLLLQCCCSQSQQKPIWHSRLASKGCLFLLWLLEKNPLIGHIIR